ncbi:hypothetical protein Plim_1867 [Planctopirus limnophila DSM 3776]|uniref:BioF2-like acetyltransferase domain-containing protein n=2 Tax=Planctopirus limnophila TaxID=120 RepID=D5SYG9_PLAL2|nr:hypothetical protein Plim_1867 [Planctopirus limnophila DSM 3776]
MLLVMSSTCSEAEKSLEEGPVCIRRLHPLDVSQFDLMKWRTLFSESIEPNVFLDPEFVIPLIEEVPTGLCPILLIAEDLRTGRWLGLCLFEVACWSLLSPLPMARGLASPYAFQQGWLVSRESEKRAIDALLDYQLQQREWHGFQIKNLPVKSMQTQLMIEAAERLGISVTTTGEWQRAEYVTGRNQTTEDLLQACSKSRRKSLKRCRRALEELGEVQYRLEPVQSSRDPQVNDFLRLEKSGWKLLSGTAIGLKSADEAFFRRMIDGLAREKRVLFGELQLNGQTIASTCNLQSGDTLVGFKIGWDPAYSAGAPGLWSELEMAAAVSQRYPEITRIDSCAVRGSYVESVWKDRQELFSGTFSWSRRGKALQAAKSCYRTVRDLCQSSVKSHDE